MLAGKLDRRITINRATETRDGFNNVVLTWAPLATVWASKLEISDGERIGAMEVGAEITTRFQIRWAPVVEDVNPKDRVIFNGRVHDIFGVKELGRRIGYEITTKARAD
jgi:SPP1 family predicted phage head-tail adaptor